MRPSVLFATTALVLLASSLARTGQRPVSLLPILHRLASLSLSLCHSFTFLSLSPSNLRSSNQLSLIRCTGKLTWCVHKAPWTLWTKRMFAPLTASLDFHLETNFFHLAASFILDSKITWAAATDERTNLALCRLYLLISGNGRLKTNRKLRGNLDGRVLNAVGI